MTRFQHELAVGIADTMRRFADAIDTNEVTDIRMFDIFTPMLKEFTDALVENRTADAENAAYKACSFMDMVEADIEENNG